MINESMGSILDGLKEVHEGTGTEKTKGLTKALSEYKKYNKGGKFSPEYAYLMYDKEEDKIWSDYFFDLGHNSFKKYQGDSVINLGRYIMDNYGKEVSKASVETAIADIKSGKSL